MPVNDEVPDKVIPFIIPPHSIYVETYKHRTLSPVLCLSRA
mgnify:FL=1